MSKAQQQQVMHQQEEIFDSLFNENNSHQLWVQMNENTILKEQDVIHQGRLFTKNSRSKKQHFFHFELYSDMLVRVGDPEESIEPNNGSKNGDFDSNGKLDSDQHMLMFRQSSSSFKGLNKNSEKEQELNVNSLTSQNKRYYLELQSCFLKKIRYSDHQLSNYRFGIRLQRGDQKCELFTENAESFNKWYEEIKRFCLLGKFNKKYKILTKMKTSQSDYFQQFRGFRFNDSNQVCIRVIDKYNIKEFERKHLIKEMNILRMLNHPLLLKLIEVYEDEANIFIIFDLYHNKSLKSKLKEYVCFDERVVSDIMWKLLHGIAHMHSKNIVHRDIRLNTIFYKNSNNIGDICLGGFQNAELLLQNDQNKPPYLKVDNGTGIAGYRAPELYIQGGEYNEKVDIFALGCVFYALIFGVLPFEGETEDIIDKQNQQCQINFNLTPPFFKLSTSCKDLLMKMLDKNPQKRGNAQNMMNHTWFINIRSKGMYDNKKTNNNNFNGFSSLSTIKENMSELDCHTHLISSKIFPNMPSISNNSSLNLNDHFYSLKQNNNNPSNFNQNSQINQFPEDEDQWDDDQDPYSPQQKVKLEFEYESLSDKMGVLNNYNQMKPPSKQYHDNCKSLKENVSSHQSTHH